jgi:hypothetical protein
MEAYMALSGAAILVDGTITPSGGTSTNWATLGNSPNLHQLFLDDSAEFVLQTKILAQANEGRVQTSAPNGYTQHRSSFKLSVPIIPTDRNRTVNTIQLIQATDVYTTDAQNLSMRVLAAQLLIASAYEEFWVNRSMA